MISFSEMLFRIIDFFIYYYVRIKQFTKYYIIYFLCLDNLKYGIISRFVNKLYNNKFEFVKNCEYRITSCFIFEKSNNDNYDNSNGNNDNIYDITKFMIIYLNNYTSKNMLYKILNKVYSFSEFEVVIRLENIINTINENKLIMKKLQVDEKHKIIINEFVKEKKIIKRIKISGISTQFDPTYNKSYFLYKHYDDYDNMVESKLLIDSSMLFLRNEICIE